MIYKIDISRNDRSIYTIDTLVGSSIHQDRTVRITIDKKGCINIHHIVNDDEDKCLFDIISTFKPIRGVESFTDVTRGSTIGIQLYVSDGSGKWKDILIEAEWPSISEENVLDATPKVTISTSETTILECFP